MEVLDYC